MSEDDRDNNKIIKLAEVRIDRMVEEDIKASTSL
jgi:hypothetical protein